MAGKPKRKASAFTDEERADAVALLLMQGWPKKKGALTSTAKHLNIWPRTLSRWAKGESNPPPDNIVTKKTEGLAEAMEAMLWSILGHMGLTVEDATFREQAIAYGIIFDKLQLSTGGPTENINQRVLVLDFGDTPNDNGNGRTIQD
jgi:hypothetical protein